MRCLKWLAVAQIGTLGRIRESDNRAHPDLILGKEESEVIIGETNHQHKEDFPVVSMY